MGLHIPDTDHAEEYAAGVADTVATVVPGIKSNDTLLAVLTIAPAASVAGQDITDFTVADGTITAGTIDNTGLSLLVLYAREPSA